MDDMRRLSFSEEEYHRRLQAVQQIMAREELEALVVSDLTSICYLCGFQTIGSYSYGMYALIVGQYGEPTLFTSDFESYNAQLDVWLDDVVTYEYQNQLMRSPAAQLADLVQQQGHTTGRIGCEQGHFAMTVREFRDFSEALSGVEIVDASDLIEQVRVIKSDDEIAVMRRAAELTTAGMNAGIAAAAEGNTDNDIAAAAYDTIVRGGGEYFSLQPIVTSGRRSGIPHSTFRRNQLRQGDCVLMEVSAAWQRYSAPTMRTVAIGAPSDEIRRTFDGCLASVSTFMDNARDGASGQEVARRAGNALRAIVPDLVWHGCYAYSVGLGFPPMCTDCKLTGGVTETREFILQAGMTFHCSTSLRKAGEFGVTVSETILITGTGCEALTAVPQELFVR